MEIRKVSKLELDTELLLQFNRHQEVLQKWVKDKDKWILKDVSEVRTWDVEKKDRLINNFRLRLDQGDLFIGAFEDTKLVGFVLLGGKIHGSTSKYVNLSMLFVTKDKRALGIGNKLFVSACESAVKLGADKLFVSAYSAKDTVAFYKKIGCTDAVEVIPEFIDTPEDYYLEYKINQ